MESRIGWRDRVEDAKLLLGSSASGGDVVTRCRRGQGHCAHRERVGSHDVLLLAIDVRGA